MIADLEPIIAKAWDERDTLGASTRGRVRDAVETAIAMLDSGTVRVAENWPVGVADTSTATWPAWHPT